LRHDPLLKLACGRLPTEEPLASQPTLSRLENAVDARTCYRLALALVQLYLQERGRAGRPGRIVLDFDGTDDPAISAGPRAKLGPRKPAGGDRLSRLLRAVYGATRGRTP
jgi:hypothetical protein